MGDTTQLQLFIHDVPQGEVWALSDLLWDQGLAVDWDGPEAERGTVHVGTPYTNRLVAGDESETLANLIVTAAPGASFTVWTDPAYEWLGSLVRYTPALGQHLADCDASGEPQFTGDQILRAVNVGYDKVRALIGADWSNALTGSTDERTLTADEPDEAGR